VSRQAVYYQMDRLGPVPHQLPQQGDKQIGVQARSAKNLLFLMRRQSP
jgi:hypothetical protein